MPRKPVIERSKSPSKKRGSKKPILRIDPPHRPVRHSSSPDVRPDTEPSKGSASLRNAITFGVLVYLFGQVLVFAGSYAGLYSIWGVGSLLSIGGVAFGLLSVVDAFKRYELRLQAIENTKPGQERNRVRNKRRNVRKTPNSR